MINIYDILETIRMIQDECLDIRTITMGISLLDCIDSDIDKACEKVYNKITSKAKDLVKTGERIEKEYGIPIIPVSYTHLTYRISSSRLIPHNFIFIHLSSMKP